MRKNQSFLERNFDFVIQGSTSIHKARSQKSAVAFGNTCFNNKQGSTTSNWTVYGLYQMNIVLLQQNPITSQVDFTFVE